MDLTRLYREHLDDLDRRYAPVLAEAGFDAVVIHSGSAKKRSEFDDQYWPLRPVPHFQHWVPLNVADCALLIEPGGTRTLFWLTAQSYWERPAPLESDHFEGQWHIVRITAAEDVKAHLPVGKRLAFIGEDKARAESWGLQVEAHNPFDLVGRLDRLRVFKTPYEVLCLAEANRRAALGHDAVVQAFQSGAHSELELHLAYLAATGQDDPETPYKNIVALGKNGATLHHISYEKRALDKASQSLLLDAGATFLGYCSDITRTWWKGTGATASAFGHMVDLTERMQLQLCDAVQIGLPYEELHERAHRDVAGILHEIGAFQCSVDEAVEHKLSRSFLPHGLGHSLGLQCHDVGCALVKPRPENPYLRNTSIIEPGQCFTIEPGIYFIDFLMDELRQGEHGSLVNWPLVDSLAELGGVRIEDDLVVTSDGTVHRNLTREWLPSGGGRA